MQALSKYDLNGVLKYFQDKTGIPGYDHQQSQNAKRPYFYFEPPRPGKSSAAGGFFQHRVTIHGVLFCPKEGAKDDQSEMQDVMAALDHWIAAEKFRIQCADENYEPYDAWLEEVQLSYQKADVDIITFQVRGERFVAYPQEEVTLTRHVYNNITERSGTTWQRERK
jgi:hypothetical protein